MGMRGVKATAPPKSQDVSLLPVPAPQAGCMGMLALHPKTSTTRALGLPSSSSAPARSPQPIFPLAGDAQGCTWGIGRNKGRVIPLSCGSQHVVPAWWREPRLAEGHSCPKTCWCWQSGHMSAIPAPHAPCSQPPAQERGWHCWGTPELSQAPPSSLGSPSQQGTGQGVSNPLLPSRKGGSSSHGTPHKPPALRWAPSAQAQLTPQTHHTSGGGEVAWGGSSTP